MKGDYFTGNLITVEIVQADKIAFLRWISVNINEDNSVTVVAWRFGQSSNKI